MFILRWVFALLALVAAEESAETLESLRSANLRLTLDVERLSEENKAASVQLEQLAHMEAQIDDYELKLRAEAELKKEYVSALDEWREHADRTDKELAKAKEVAADVDATVERRTLALTEELAAVREELAKAAKEATRVLDAERLYHDSRSEVAESALRLEKSLAESASLRAEVEQYSQDLSDAQSAAADATREADKLRQKLSGLAEEIGSCESDRRHLAAQHEEALARAVALEQSHADAVLEFEDIKARLVSEKETRFYTSEAYQRDLLRLFNVLKVLFERATGVQGADVQSAAVAVLLEVRRLGYETLAYARTQREVLIFILDPYYKQLVALYDLHCHDAVQEVMSVFPARPDFPWLADALTSARASWSTQVDSIDWSATGLLALAETHLPLSDVREAAAPILSYILSPLRDPRIAPYFSLAPFDLWYTALFLAFLTSTFKNQVVLYTGLAFGAVKMVLRSVFCLLRGAIRAVLWVVGSALRLVWLVVKSIVCLPFSIISSMCRLCFRRKTTEAADASKRSRKKTSDSKASDSPGSKKSRKKTK